MRSATGVHRRNPHKPGAAQLRRALGADVTLSELEDAFLALLERNNARRRRSRHVAFTYGDVVETGDATVAELRQLLSRARSSPTRLDPRAYST